MQLRCPVQTSHVLVEIAPGVYQCPDCGAGPIEFWSLAYVDIEGGSLSALCSMWRADLECYVLSHVAWMVDQAGRRTPSEMHAKLMGYASTADELAQTPLPVVTPGEVVRLRVGMFSSPVGERSDQRAGRGGRSAGGPSPSGSSGRSPRHRRKAGG